MPDLAAWVQLLTSLGPSGLLMVGIWMIIQGLLQPKGQVTSLIEQLRAEFTRTVEQKDREYTRMADQKDQEYTRMVAAKDQANTRLEEDIQEWRQIAQDALTTLAQANPVAGDAAESAIQVATRRAPPDPPETGPSRRRSS